MFNQSDIWTEFLAQVKKDILAQLSTQPVVVEIGHGDGSFLAGLAETGPGGRYIGFDPHGAVGHIGGVELRAELFDPAVHLQQLAPDMVISRHVLEHLLNPLAFLQHLSFAATWLKQKTVAYFEVPCIDQAIRSGRTVDYYYEHSSQFTTKSFTRMLQVSGTELLEVGHGYGGEVVFGFVRLDTSTRHVDTVQAAQYYFDQAEKSLTTIKDQLARLLIEGRKVAVWGGTGKSAAFLCRYGMDAERFPLVVDSDKQKVGTFVPGTGQKIQFRDSLIDHPVDVLIIPPQWRAVDIMAEMIETNITAHQVLIEHQGRLIDFRHDDHFYD